MFHQGSVARSSSTLLVHHAAKKLGLSRRMVRHLAETGVLPARKLGKKIWGFDSLDVEDLRLRREADDV
jgi:ribosomal protein S14